MSSFVQWKWPLCGLIVWLLTVSCNADDEDRRVVQAIARLRSEPHWAHLNIGIVPKVAANRRSGPELNATIHVVDPDGNAVADAVLVVGESERDLANYIYFGKEYDTDILGLPIDPKLFRNLLAPAR
jgi:hypothetical protein